LNNPLPDLTAQRPDTPPALVELISRMLQKKREQRIPSVRLVGAALEAIMEGSDTPLPGILPKPGQPGDPASRFATPTPPITREAAPLESEAPLVIIHGSTPFAAPTPPPTAAAAPVPAPAAGRKWWALGGIAVVLIVVAALAVALGLFGGSDDGKNGAPASDQIAQVAPVSPGEYMVLVARLEPLKGADRGDVTRFIVENLQQTLEVEIPFSTIRIREYPQIITTEDAAQAAAEANGATVIVWGNYTPDETELNVEIGVTTAFPLIRIDRDTLERSANVRIRMTDERRESIAAPVLGVFNVLQTADGNGYEVARILAILDALEVTHAEIISGGVAGYLQRAALVYMEDTPQAVEQYNAAITLQGGNPILYAFRAAGYMRQGLFDKALRDIETAQRLGPPDWTSPLYVEAIYAVSVNDFDRGLALFDRIVALRPDDWFAVDYRGTLYYLKGDYEHARADLEHAVELGPSASFPYVVLAMLTAHEGRLQDMQQYQRIVITQFPDPTFSTRLIKGIYGDLPFAVSPMLSAAGNLILGQYEQVIIDTETALAIDSQLVDMYLVQGLSYCNLDDYVAAEAAYSRGIEVAPDFIALYALRAEVRARQGNLTGSMQDALTVRHSDVGAVFIDLMTSAMEGRWNCKEFFNYDYSQLETTDEQ
jgi:tetratricopeptide (TPR) repeat protein